jgi:hypothetical protein
MHKYKFQKPNLQIPKLVSQLYIYLCAMEIEKKDIRSLTKEQLRDFFVANGDKAFRGNQVYEWL